MNPKGRPTPAVMLAVTMNDGTVAFVQFVIENRSPTLPPGAFYIGDSDAFGHMWAREPNRANVEEVLNKGYAGWQSWRLMRQGEQVPQNNTPYRPALRDNGNLYYDMPTARQLHLTLLRAQRVERMATLDAEWMRAMGQRNQLEADAIEAQRQALRDAPQTLAPAIAAALTVEELKAIRLP